MNAAQQLIDALRAVISPDIAQRFHDIEESLLDIQAELRVKQKDLRIKYESYDAKFADLLVAMDKLSARMESAPNTPVTIQNTQIMGSPSDVNPLKAPSRLGVPHHPNTHTYSYS